MKTIKAFLLLATLLGFAFSPIDSKVGGAYATFNGKFGGEITRADLATTSELGVAGCAAGSRIFTFTLTIVSPSKTVTFKGTSHEFTADMMMSLKSMRKGDTFEFTKMKAKLPSGGIVDVTGKKFIII